MDIDKILDLAGNNPIQLQLIQRKARKPWTCQTCETPILPGSLYWNRMIRAYGSFEPVLSEHFCRNHEPLPILKQLLARQREKVDSGKLESEPYGKINNPVGQS